MGWLNNPEDKQVLWKDSKWPIFQQACSDNFSFDPEKDAIGSVLLKLCEAEGEWQTVWQRFKDTAHNLPLLVEPNKPKIVEKNSIFIPKCSRCKCFLGC